MKGSNERLQNIKTTNDQRMPRPFHHHHKRGFNNQQGSGSSSNSVKRHQQQSRADDYVPENYLQLIRSLGNTQEDVERWRAERRLKFPRQQRASNDNSNVLVHHQQEHASSSSMGLSALFAAYDTDEEETATTETTKNAASDVSVSKVVEQNLTKHEEKPKICVYFSRNGRCKYGEKCRNKHVETSAVTPIASSHESLAKEKHMVTKTSSAQQHILEKLLEDVGFGFYLKIR